MINTARTEYVLSPQKHRGLRTAVELMRQGYRVAAVGHSFSWQVTVHAFPDEREYPWQKDYGPRSKWIRIPHVNLVALPARVKAGHAWPDAQLAEAEYDVLHQVLTITADDGAQYVFRGRLGGIRAWDREEYLFHTVNDVAKQVHCLVYRITVVNTAEPVFDYVGDYEEDRVAANEHAKAHIVGAALDKDDDRKRWIVWAALVGPRIALESLKATLARGNTLREGRGWGRNWRLRKPARFTLQPVPDLPGQYLLIIAQEAMLQADRENRVGYIVLTEEGESAGPHLIRHLQQATDLPILPEWGEALWQAAREGVPVLTRYGDVRTVPLVERLQTRGLVHEGWRVDLNPEHWGNVLRNLLQEGVIRIDRKEGVEYASAG